MSLKPGILPECHLYTKRSDLHILRLHKALIGETERGDKKTRKFSRNGKGGDIFQAGERVQGSA